VQTSSAVQRLDGPARRPPLDPGDRGATYRWLDQRAVRVVTTFTDAVAITERVPGGDLKTRLSDTAGRDLAEFAVDRDSGSDVLSFRSADQGALRASGRPGAEPTLDWSNRQVYAMWKDKAEAAGASLEWQSGLVRARGARPVDFDRETIAVQTEWFDGFVARSTRSVGRRANPKTGAVVRGTSLESRLTRDNVDVGKSRWYPEEQIYVWSVPGLTSGDIDVDRMKAVGGWTFTPDLAWTNIQTYAFHYFHTLVATQGFVARSHAPRPKWLSQFTNAVMPTLVANEPGCDGLHWLDNTIYRPCCDIHDRCYSKYGCSSRSWWEWWSSWRCTGCNVVAVVCMSTRGPFYKSLE
jgi:hypothetical protein